MNKITVNYQTVSPAYGRDYRNAKDAQADFLSGKDFVMESLGHSGTYCSVHNFASGVTVSVRYNKKQKVINVKVP